MLQFVNQNANSGLLRQQQYFQHFSRSIIRIMGFSFRWKTFKHFINYPTKTPLKDETSVHGC